MAMERLAKTDLPPEVKIIDANKLEKLSIPFFLKVEVYGRRGVDGSFFDVSQVVDTKSIFSYIAQMLKSEAGDEYVSKVILSMPSDDYDLEELFLETDGELGKYGHLKKGFYRIHMDARDSEISEDYLAEVISALDGGVLTSGVLTRIKKGEFGLFGGVSFLKTTGSGGSSKRHIKLKPMHSGDFITLAIQETWDYWINTNTPNSSSDVHVELHLSEGVHSIPKDKDIRKLIFIFGFVFRLNNSVISFGERLDRKSFLSDLSSSVFYKGSLALKIDSILVEKINNIYSNKGTGKHAFHVKGNIEMVPLLVVAEGFQESRSIIKTTHDYEGSTGFLFGISRNISYLPVVREGEKGMSVEVFDRSGRVGRSITLRSFSKLTGDFLKAMGKFSGKFVESALAKPLEEMVNFLAQGVELCVSGRRVRVFPLSNTLSEVSPEKLREQIRSSLKEFLEKRKIAYSKALLDMLSSNLSESFFPLYRQEGNGKFRFVPYYVVPYYASREKNGIESSFTFLRANEEGAGKIYTTIAANIVTSEEASEDRVFLAFSPILRTLDWICPMVNLWFHTYE